MSEIKPTEGTLKEVILRHMEAVGSINALIAAKEYGTNDLRDQIYFLRKHLKSENKERWIKTTFHKSPLKGERYATYTLMKGTKPARIRSCQSC